MRRRPAGKALALALGVLVLASGVLGVPDAAGASGSTGACQQVETWHEVGVDSFPAPTGFTKSQGITTDGKSWYFSWQYGLEHTTDSYLPIRSLPMDIPPALAATGSNHIGDFDYYQGKLVVPIDDSNSGYTRPYLALYDASTLLPISYYPITHELPDAASWVAVDPRTGLALTTRWSNPTQVNLFDANDHMRYVGGIGLQQPLSRIQGAKLLNGSLIAAVDDAAKSVYRIDLETGAVTRLFSLNLSGEMEGISVRSTPDGALVHVLLVVGSVNDPQNLHVELHHWARSEQEACPNG